VQRAAEGEFPGTAAERFLGANARDVRRIVLLGKMREDQMLRARIKQFRVREKIADYRVRKMARAAHHALLDVPRIGTHLQHIEIVIRLQNQKIGFAQILFHKLGHVAEIGDDHYLDSVRAEAVTNRIGGVVGDGERSYFDVADFKSYAGTNVFDALDFSYRAVLAQPQDFAMRQLREIGRAFPVARHLRHGAGMIAVLVSDQDGVHVVGTQAAQRFETPQHFLAAKACVNEESGMACLEQRAVARASRRQNGYSERDRVSQSGFAREELRAGAAKMMANCGAHVNKRNSSDELKNKLVAGEESHILAFHSTKTSPGTRDHSKAKIARTYPLFSIF
jgi:hypothetical protein